MVFQPHLPSKAAEWSPCLDAGGGHAAGMRRKCEKHQPDVPLAVRLSLPHTSSSCPHPQKLSPLGIASPAQRDTVSFLLMPSRTSGPLPSSLAREGHHARCTVQETFLPSSSPSFPWSCQRQESAWRQGSGLSVPPGTSRDPSD